MTVSSLFIQIYDRGITASCVILAVMFVRFLFRRMGLPKKYSYYLWAIPAVRLICPLSFSSVISIFNLFEREEVKLAAKRVYTPFQNYMPQGESSMPQSLSSEMGSTAVYAADHQGFLLLAIAAGVWIAGMTVLMIYSVFSYLRLRKKTRTAVLLKEQIYECSEIASPFVLGVFRPRIYIPFRMKDAEREYILSHEEYHIRRHDPLIKMLFYAIAVVYWFHPLVWLAFVCMGSDMEMSCDEKVLLEKGNEIKGDYSRSLLAFASNRRFNLQAPLSFGESATGKRIKNVLDFKRPKTWFAAAGIVLIAAVAAVCLTNGTGGDAGRTQEQTVLPRNYEECVKNWAEAFCSRDGETIYNLAEEEALNWLEDRSLVSKVQGVYSVGRSSPWPIEPARDFRIVEMNETSAKVLYYAWTSDPHVTVWRENLTLKNTDGKYTVAKDTIEYFDTISTAEEFDQAYPDGIINGTPMDYSQNGAGEALNTNALQQKSSKFYQDLFDPAEAARCLLNLTPVESLAEIESESAGTDLRQVTIYFPTDGKSVKVSMIQPYGADGIWIPQTASEFTLEDGETEAADRSGRISL